jgi:soluble lytic murein transglycosylase-like protein
MALTARLLGFPPHILPSIQAVEGGQPGVVHLNKDGSADLGLMQINTLWVPDIAEVAHETIPETQARLVREPCFNIQAAALILRAYWRENGGAWMPAIGDYHSHTRPLNLAYQAHVMQKARLLFAGP